MSPIDEPRLSPWEEEGRRQGATLDGCHFVVLIGDEPGDAAELALGLARVQARRRRAVVADGVGELPCIEDLAPMDAPHGIVDVCIHGVSLGQVAHRVEGAGNLEIVPSGPIPFDRTATLRSPRWMRLATEFRESGAILLLIVPEHEPAVEAILPLADGVILTGRAQPWPSARVLLYVRAPGTRASGTMSGPPTPVFTPRVTPTSMPTVTPPRAAPAARLTTARPPIFEDSSHWPLWITVATAVLILGYGAWRWQASRGAAAPVAAAASAPSDGGSITPSAAVDSADAANSSPEAVAQRAAAAAADSNARAAAWAVEVTDYTSATSANAVLEEDAVRTLPAATWSPVADSNGDRHWRLYAGAWPDRAPADSLLAALRAKGMIAQEGGRVLRLPFAVIVQSGATRDDASFFATGLRSKGLPVYPLVGDNGTVRLYAGAFERAADAALLVATLRANGETPSVTYRIGRTP